LVSWWYAVLAVVGLNRSNAIKVGRRFNMKTLTTVFLSTFLLLLSSSSVFSADKDKAILDALSAEAKETSMDEGSAPVEDISEPSISPESVTNYSDLEEKIAAQIKGLLVEKTKNKKEESTKESDFKNKLENVVSGALLKGNKLDDIRNAVSAAMLNINSKTKSDISEGTIKSAKKALKSIVGENKAMANGDKQDAYVQSLKVEVATTDSTKESATMTTVTVLEGETLFKIAQRIYGSGANYLALYEANKDTLKDPNLIRVGQVLKIPSAR